MYLRRVVAFLVVYAGKWNTF
eukprot:SAG22_NODE_17822_length_298_cov_0.597990_1_plen_20_part_01